MSVTVRKIEDLIPFPDKNAVAEYKVTSLLNFGENFGGRLFSVKMCAKNSGESEEFHRIVKLIPLNETIQKRVNIETTFRKEIAFYKYILPILMNFQKNCGVNQVVDFAPRYFGSRINLENDDKGRVDLDGALVLENLGSIGFVNLDRLIGFNLETTNFLLGKLADFHAVSLAFKLRQSNIIENNLKSYLKPHQVSDIRYNGLLYCIQTVVSAIPEAKPIQDRILAGAAKMRQSPRVSQKWNAIIHNDCWCNNFMVKLTNGKLSEARLVDFQTYQSGSPAKDFLSMVFSSVKCDILKNNFDSFVEIYFNNFLKRLHTLGCKICLYSLEDFYREIDQEAVTLFGDLFYKTWFIFAPKLKNAEDVDESTANFNIVEKLSSLPPSELQIERFRFLIMEFSRRNWI